MISLAPPPIAALAAFSLLAACSRDSGSCVPLATVADECPPSWDAVPADQRDFCAENAGLYDTFRSSAPCHGRLVYARYLFDAGPLSCAYDATTRALVGYWRSDPKASFERLSCGSQRSDFAVDGCSGTACEARCPRRPPAPAVPPPGACRFGAAYVTCTLPSGGGCACVSDDPATCSGCTGATSCESVCKAGEYAAACGGPPRTADGGPLRQDDPPAGCHSVAVVPSGLQYYCCPCD
jgi:hypothetical protein